MNNLPSYKLIGFWVVVLLLILGAAGWLVWSIDSTSTQVQQLAGEIEQSLQQNVSLEKFRKISKESVKEQEKINTYLISKNNAVGFIEELEAIGDHEQLIMTIDSVNEKPIPQQNRNLLSLNVSLKGSWQRVFRTLHLIETMPHKVTISSLNLKQVSTETGSSTGSRLWEGVFVINAAMTK